MLNYLYSLGTNQEHIFKMCSPATNLSSKTGHQTNLVIKISSSGPHLVTKIWLLRRHFGTKIYGVSLGN